jgi:hypothetical protein
MEVSFRLKSDKLISGLQSEREAKGPGCTKVLYELVGEM